MSCHTFLCSHKFHKIENYFSFEVLKKKCWPIFKELKNFLPIKLSLISQKMGLGSGIRKKPIPDPGSRGQKGTGSRIQIRNTEKPHTTPATPSSIYLHIIVQEPQGRDTRVGFLIGSSEDSPPGTAAGSASSPSGNHSPGPDPLLVNQAVLRIRIRIRRIHMFLSVLRIQIRIHRNYMILALPDPLVRYTDLDPNPDPSIIKQK
jgi:hypothetical protein